MVAGRERRRACLKNRHLAAICRHLPLPAPFADRSGFNLY